MLFVTEQLVIIEDMSRFGSKLENLFLRRICSSFSKVFSCKTWPKRHGRWPGWKPITDERTGTPGCGEVPATKGDEVQRVLRWCKVLHVYLPACGASAHLKNRRRRREAARRGAAHGKEATAAGAHSHQPGCESCWTACLSNRWTK